MRRTRHTSAQPDASKVVSITPYLPPITAIQLISEAKNIKNGPGASLAQTIMALPEMLTGALDQVLKDFDYRRNTAAPTAIACRMLAVVTAQISGRLEELQ